MGFGKGETRRSPWRWKGEPKETGDAGFREDTRSAREKSGGAMSLGGKEDRRRLPRRGKRKLAKRNSMTSPGRKKEKKKNGGSFREEKLLGWRGRKEKGERPRERDRLTM